MPTLFVENFPEDLYQALKARAKANRRSMAAEVISIFEEIIPGQEELNRRESLLKTARQFQAKKPLRSTRFPPAEDMVREDRNR